MNHPLMEYIPTSPADPARSIPSANNLPPLNLVSVRQDYYGRKAYDYDLDRETSEKWQREFVAVKKGLEGITGKLLDIPCGTGRFFPVYRKLGLDFVGMDVSEDMMTQARAKVPDVPVVYGDAEKIPLDDKAVACSVCIRFLEKLPEAEMALVLKELGRVTKQRILCGNITGDAPSRRRRSYVHRWDVFKKAVCDAGFRIAVRAPIREPELNIWMLEAR